MRHTNIITILGLYYEDSSKNTLPILVMEPVHFNLSRYLQSNNGSHEWNELFGILEEVSNGLLYLHENQKISHNNISHRTILLTDHLVVKISCFEYAKKINFDCSVKPNKDSFPCDTYADIYTFSNIMYSIISHGAYSENLHEVLKFAEQCTKKCTEKHPSSNEILDAIKKYR